MTSARRWRRPTHHPGRRPAGDGEELRARTRGSGADRRERRGRGPSRQDPLDFYRMLQETDVADAEVRRTPSTGGWPPARSSRLSSPAATG